MSYMINSAKTILSCSRQFAQSTQTSKATNVTKPLQYIVKHLKTIPLGLLPYINSGPKKKKIQASPKSTRQTQGKHPSTK